MATTIEAPQQLTLADFKGKSDPDWCPGCGDFGVLAAVQKALVDLQIPTHNVVTIDRKSTRLNSSHIQKSRMPSSA